MNTRHHAHPAVEFDFSRVVDRTPPAVSVSAIGDTDEFRSLYVALEIALDRLSTEVSTEDFEAVERFRSRFFDAVEAMEAGRGATHARDVVAEHAAARSACTALLERR